MEENKQILSVRNLVVKYITRDETVEAVNDVSFDVNYGETLGLVGETGAGKTTIAKAIMRILQTPPARIVSGEILLDGETDLVQLGNRSRTASASTAAVPKRRRSRRRATFWRWSASPAHA